MYVELTKEELLEDAQSVKDFVIASGYSELQLIELSESLIKEKNYLNRIYILNGNSQSNYPSFNSIRLAPRFVIKGGQTYTDTSGLIFPQNEPIILIIENFDTLKEVDQSKYLETICQKEERVPHHNLSLHKDSIVVLGISSTAKIPEISYKLNVRKLI
ncbi:hypothetical protein [Aquirufa nivalisilvae]|uniref:hypothetical protein n=1 Tax=Aquirufa nivalisilvae TaxID=2516557 RepID=UPI0022A9A08A|nr:hypothetical protein [Aquirufa nivalisilvae]MCZ2479333.1 hypothetical protein [Aquirufa nivalisilvae]